MTRCEDELLFLMHDKVKNLLESQGITGFNYQAVDEYEALLSSFVFDTILWLPLLALSSLCGLGLLVCAKSSKASYAGEKHNPILYRCRIVLLLPVLVMVGEPDCQYTWLLLPRTVMLLQEPSKVTVFEFPLTTTALPLQVKVRV